MRGTTCDEPLLEDGELYIDKTLGKMVMNIDGVDVFVNKQQQDDLSTYKGKMTSGSYIVGVQGAIGVGSHAEGSGTRAIGQFSHTEGGATFANGVESHAEGRTTIANGDASHAEGSGTQAIGIASHAEGQNARAIGIYSHAEGGGEVITSGGPLVGCHASGEGSHAEGIRTEAAARGSHSEGYLTLATGPYSHAEGGSGTQAIGFASHAEGERTRSIGNGSHAEGVDTRAEGIYSHAEGNGTIALGEYQHTSGSFNVSDSTSLIIVGRGSSNSVRSNSFRIGNTGTVFTASGTVSSGADYAEYFESVSGEEIPYGTVVQLNGAKIEVCTDPSNAIGVISPRPAILGDSEEDCGVSWKNKFLKDIWGNYIMEDITVQIQVPEEYTEIVDEIEITRTRLIDDEKVISSMIINPEYDPALTYIPRSERPEWNVVGLLGKLKILKNQQIPSTWRFMRDINEDIAEYLVK